MPAPSRRHRPLGWLGAVTLSAAAVAACDGTTRARDAGAPATPRAAEVALRIDVPAGGSPALSALAFRALVSGTPTVDLLGAVDPLMGAAPGTRCELRRVDDVARELRAGGGSVELEELPAVSIEAGTLSTGPADASDASSLRSLGSFRLAPRVFPELSGVAGVVAEVGPADLGAVPQWLRVRLPGGTEAAARLPEAPRLRNEDGTALVTGKLRAGSDLVFYVEGSQRTFVELRPFGATVSAACPVGYAGKVVVPHDVVDALVGSHGRTPVSVEAVWRDTQLVSTGSAFARLSIETRASALLEPAP